MNNIIHGDCRFILKDIPDNSIDSIITDPPYPCIDRDYGYWTEPEWHALIHEIVYQARRILKPTGSAVFILHPNSEKIGVMRSWLWEFMTWCCKEWNIIQDVYWWNVVTMPSAHCNRKNGLMRSSLKTCVWVGDPSCYRNQEAILWATSDAFAAEKREDRIRVTQPSGYNVCRHAIKQTVRDRGGVTPFNVIPMGNTDSTNKHSASTPKKLCYYWINYICPPNGVVLDPFCGHGNIPLTAVELGRNFIGIEQHPEFVEIAKKRIKQFQSGDLFAV